MNHYISKDERYFILRSDPTKPRPHYKPCYLVVPDPKNRLSYKVEVKPGYTKERIYKDQSGQALSQILKYDAEGDFNKFYCKKDCPVGYFYDFDSIDCRLCKPGCRSCDSIEKCHKGCEEGSSFITEPQYLIHKKDYLKLTNEGFKCTEGCQRGFFFSKEQGSCLECDQDCSACEPNPNYKRHRYSDEPMSICLKCRSGGLKSELYLNSRTRQCSPHCTKPNAISKIIKKIGNETNSLFCIECEVKNCTLCDIKNTKKCIECNKGTSLSKNSEFCTKIITLFDKIKIGLKFFRLILIFVVFSWIVGVIFKEEIKKILGCISKYFQPKNENQEESNEKQNSFFLID